MTEYVKQDMTRRYFQEYFNRAKKGAGLWPMVARSSRAFVAIGAGGAVVSIAMATILPVTIPAVAYTLGKLGVAAGIVTCGVRAKHKVAEIARKDIAKDIDNGALLPRYKNDLLADERWRLSAATKILSAIEKASTLDDFQNVAAKRAELVNESAAQRPAPKSAPKNGNSLK